MYHIEFIKHMDMTQLDLVEVVNLKKKQWNYTVDEHLKWIAENLKASDIHVFLTLENKNVAYLNLIDLNVFVDNEIASSWGVGNVCAVERGKGFGYKIMKETNKYINESERIGFLYCKSKLLNFYSSLGWCELSKENHTKLNEELRAMVLNLKLNTNTYIEYDGQIF